jgi:polyadenylate-binding protein
MQYDDLAALSPVVRREVLAGELSRRVKELETVTVADDEVETIVDSLMNLSLTQVVEGIHSATKLSEQVTSIQKSQASKLETPIPEKSSSNSPAPSQDSRLLDPQALIATASAPEQPSTPLSISGSISDPPRTSSPSGSTSASGERERLLAAVSGLEPSSDKATAITDLLMSLSKRERAMCLFSKEILKQKIKEAEEIFKLENEPEEKPTEKPAPQKKASSPAVEAPSASSLTTAPSSSADAPANGSSYTLTSLAELPAIEIIRLAREPSSASTLPLPKADSLVMQSTDNFVDSLQSQGQNQQKQAVGEKLFKFVKAAGGGRLAVSAFLGTKECSLIPSQGKITIQLLDNEDLRSLAHLMNSYPSVLKEKANTISKQLSAK